MTTSKCEIVKDNEHYNLYINRLQIKDDSGEYIIRAENELGITVCKTILNVESSGSNTKPRFSRLLPVRQEVIPGQSSKLECEVIADEPIKFQWYVNGIQITRSAPEYMIEDLEPMKSTLTIPIVKREMIPSEVKVRATTAKGASIVSTTIIEMSAETKEYEKGIRMPLRLIQPLQPTIRPKVDEDVVLIVAAESVPQAEINWVISNPETARRSEITPILDQTNSMRSISQLIIHNYNPALDSGVIVQAIVRTLDEELVTTCELQEEEEKEEPKTYTTSFTRSLQSEMEVMETHKVVLECSVQPQETSFDFKWYCSGIEVSPEAFKEIRVENGRSCSTLIIERAEKKHEGTVVVEVLSPQGERLVSTCNLHVVPSKTRMDVVHPSLVETSEIRRQSSTILIPKQTSIVQELE